MALTQGISLDKLNALATELEDELEDLTNPSAGGRELPAAGVTRLRLVGYRELGKGETKHNGKLKGQFMKAELEFELSGPLHPPLQFGEETVAQTMIIRVDKGTTQRNSYIKLFKALSAAYPEAKNFVQLLGKAFLGTVVHYEKDVNGEKKTFASLKDDQGAFQIRSTKFQNPGTGLFEEVPVEAQRSPLQVFLWDFPDLEQWDSLYIPGEWDNGDSKNQYQERIKRASNFEGSPIHELLLAERPGEVELAQFNTKKPAAADPLGEAAPEAPKQEAPKQAPPAPVAPPKQTAKGKGAAKAEKPAAPAPAPAPAAAEEDEEAALLAQLAAARAAKAAKAAAAPAPAAEPDAADPLAGIAG